MTSEKGLKSEETIRRVLAEYDLSPDKARPVRGGCQVDTIEGKRLLKRSWRTQEALDLAYEATDYLMSQGFKHIAPIRLSKYGDPWVKENGQLYYLTDWITGKEFIMDRPAKLKEGIQALARMQSAAIGFVPSSDHSRERRETWGERFQGKLAELERCRELVEGIEEPSEFDSLFLTEVDGFIERGKTSIQMLEQADYKTLVEEARQEGGICHRDFVGTNLIRNRRREVFIVNFDNCHLDLKVFDLGRLLAWALPGFGWDFDLVVSLLAEYTESIPLKKDDLRLLAAYLCFPQRMWFLSRRHYLEPVPEPGAMDMIQEVLVEQPVHQEFMRQCIRHYRL
ncbi:MAG: CotS family spore coat protein [Firmicutes bacterium]|nr:CotS family spore coat protein [Bacillota bacterium]